MKFKHLLLVLINGMFINITLAQSNEDIELQNRYWTYRENFRKYFTVIGWKAGEGLPFSEVKPNHSPDVAEVDANGNIIHHGNSSNIPSIKGQISIGGDVTAYFAEYLGMLTTEYWLLHNTGKAGSDEEKAVLNEFFLPTKQHFPISLCLNNNKI